MTERPSQPPDERASSGHEINIEVAPPARVIDYVDGGVANFAVDREVAEQFIASLPGGLEQFRTNRRASQGFLERVVHHLAADAGLRQFLVANWNLAGEPNVHDLAQAVAPASRVVYLALDPVQLAHAHALQSHPDGAIAYIPAKLRQPDEILRRAAATLDLAEPVAMVLPVTLMYVRRDETAYRIVAELMGGLPSGSYLAISHHADDIFVDEYLEMRRVTERLEAEGKAWGTTPRSHAAVAKFFDGLDLVEPGLVLQDEWRLTPGTRPAKYRAATWAAVARKP